MDVLVLFPQFHKIQPSSSSQPRLVAEVTPTRKPCSICHAMQSKPHLCCDPLSCSYVFCVLLLYPRTGRQKQIQRSLSLLLQYKTCSTLKNGFPVNKFCLKKIRKNHYSTCAMLDDEAKFLTTMGFNQPKQNAQKQPKLILIV